MKKILGLDLGPNSIGAAVVNVDKVNEAKIVHTVSRIIPMDAATLSDFGKGNIKSSTSQKTEFRSVRILRQRHLLRRERLHRVLALLGFLPQHFAQKLDQYGKFIDETEPKLAWNDNQFLFADSFDEMLADFRKNQPSLFLTPNSKIPHDWTMYYLRKKALTSPLSEQELAWVLISFNQKRGYYQLRGEEIEGKEGEVKEYHVLNVVLVEATDQKRGDDVWYNVHLENGWIYRRSSSTPLCWVGQSKEFIVTRKIDELGNQKFKKDGSIDLSISLPSAEDWTLLKTKTENDIKNSGKTVGHYIYDSILQNPNQKIKGKLVRVVERNLYKDELIKILEKQKEYHPKLSDKTLYSQVVEDLYRSNDDYKRTIQGRDFTYLIAHDVILYQRPLKTKKSQIADCKYEAYKIGDEVFKLKAISKSNPLYQEFRLWKFVSQLKMFYKDVDVSDQFFKTEEDYVAVFEWLSQLKEVDNASFVKFSRFAIPKSELKHYRWNYVVEKGKTYPCNETLSLINGRLKKHGLDLIQECDLTSLWHILYSVKDIEEIKKALSKFARKHNYEPQKFVTALKGCLFENEYGTYSEKAVKKLLSLMRRGKYWSVDSIDARTKQRIDNIINGVFDEAINDRTRQKCALLRQVEDFCGMDEWLASYVVYGRHAESDDAFMWESVSDIDKFLSEFKQHSMRNPIVEQVVMETMRVVRDLWKQYGKFDEIHVELGRDMKRTKREREKLSKKVAEGENANYRIRKLLEEFNNLSDVYDVRPFSPSHQTKLKIYEEFAFSQGEIPKDIAEIHDKFNEKDAKKQPKHNEIVRYKLWLEQMYRSPYTGEIIPLGKLFTEAYQIEHIIPQSLFTMNTLANKVVCEAEVNHEKTNLLGMPFIKGHEGQKITLTGGRVVTIFTEEQYLQHIEKYYANNKKKAANLKAEEIPQGFTTRQMNDSSYIARFISGLLSNVVRVDGEQEAVSKNLIATNGSITDTLKKDWGVNDVWNDIVAPRFERMNEITKDENAKNDSTKESNKYGSFVCEDGKRFFRTAIPLEFSKGFTKKRIDHRHHAMDAVIIACTTRNHVNYLNNLSSRDSDDKNDRKAYRDRLKEMLCFKHKYNEKGDYTWMFNKPSDTFTQDLRKSLDQLVVSFKQNLRVINKATNKYTKFENGVKIIETQKGLNWAIRKPMHKDTVFGEVNLRKVKTVSFNEAFKNPKNIVDKDLKTKVLSMIDEGLDVKKIKQSIEQNKEVWGDLNLSKIEVYYFTSDTKEQYFATRKEIGSIFQDKSGKVQSLDKCIAAIDSITDTGIQKILLCHLENNGNNQELAFCVDGIEQMNRDIKRLNKGKFHQPINSVRVCEKANKYAVGQTGNKNRKFVEAAKGTNLFFAVYESNVESNDAVELSGEIKNRRTFASIPLNVVIERQKQGLTPVPNDENGNSPLFVLSPNDLVYVPQADQVISQLEITDIDKTRIYKMVSCGGNQCFFVPHTVAVAIVNKVEYLSGNKMEKAISGEMIKEVATLIKTDRLGNIIKIGK